jgi:hypothetical protein
VKRSDFLWVRAVEHVAALTPDIDQADVQQYLQVFGHRRLGEPESHNDIAHGMLPWREIFQDVSTSRLGDGVERV